MKRQTQGTTLRRWFGRGLLCPILMTLLLVALSAVLLQACQIEEEGAELSGEIGPGSGSTTAPGVEVTVPIETPAGQIGTLKYDSGYFAPKFPPGAVDEVHDVCVSAAEALETLLYIYKSTMDPVSVVVSLISGRPDTPCRFSAALLARDEGFAILASGDVVNDGGLTFHQVNLAREAVFQRFYCTQLRSNLGIQVCTGSTGGDKLDFEQLHSLLNSISN